MDDERWMMINEFEFDYATDDWGTVLGIVLMAMIGK